MIEGTDDRIAAEQQDRAERAEKARTLMEAVNKLEAEYIAAGRPATARQLVEAFNELPVGSLARLHDILKA
jgi:hypothetical protein